MRFAHSFTFGPSSRGAKRRLAIHQRIGAQSVVQCDQLLSSVFSPRAPSPLKMFNPRPKEFDRISVCSKFLQA
jgi:hypothetical protein